MTSEDGRNSKPLPRLWMDMDADSPMRIAPLGPAAFLVYAYLCMRADHSGKCWPSISRIACDLRLGRTTIVHALKHLEQAGEIRRGPKAGTSTRYWVLRGGLNQDHTSQQGGSNQERTEMEVILHFQGGPLDGLVRPKQIQADWCLIRYEHLPRTDASTRHIYSGNREPSDLEIQLVYVGAERLESAES